MAEDGPTWDQDSNHCGNLEVVWWAQVPVGAPWDGGDGVSPVDETIVVVNK